MARRGDGQRVATFRRFNVSAGAVFDVIIPTDQLNQLYENVRLLVFNSIVCDRKRLPHNSESHCTALQPMLIGNTKPAIRPNNHCRVKFMIHRKVPNVRMGVNAIPIEAKRPLLAFEKVYSVGVFP